MKLSCVKTIKESCSCQQTARRVLNRIILDRMIASHAVVFRGDRIALAPHKRLLNRYTISEFANGKRRAMFSLIAVNRLCMFVKLCLQCSSTVSPILWIALCVFSSCKFDEGTSQVFVKYSFICSKSERFEESRGGKRTAHSVVFDKRQPEICLRSQAIVNSETEKFFSDANVSNVYRKGCEL